MNIPVINDAFNRDATVIKGHLRCMGNGMKVYNKVYVLHINIVIVYQIPLAIFQFKTAFYFKAALIDPELFNY